MVKERRKEKGKVVEKKEQYTIEDFLEIIRALRAEDGCPWDKAQTHESLRSCLTEEAAEVTAAIRILNQTGNAGNLCEELGDILLQVALHSQIAKEEEYFTFEDVVDGVSRKMIRRHPHVFGNVLADTESEILKNWEEIKRAEKKEQNWTVSPLRDIPPELPALLRAPKVIKKIDRLYEPQHGLKDSVKGIREAVRELEKETGAENWDKRKVEQFFADTLWELSNLARICGVSPEQALADKTECEIEKYE